MHVYYGLDNVQLHMAMLNSDIEGSVLLATHEVVQKEREEKLAENVKNRLNIYVEGNKKEFFLRVK